MAYKQTKSFNQALGGAVKGFCLRNVRLGYGIGPKYDTAWQSWQNAPQNGGDIPTGVDVPVYFSYFSAGHIGVRLANGQFWSDGKVYSSLTAYRVTHPLVVYRGWSTEVNDVVVIQYVADPTYKMPPVGSKIKLTKGTIRNTFKAGTTTVAGTIRVTDNSFIYNVLGYDPKYPNRIIINSKSAGGNGVALALYYTSGAKIDGWQQI